jgi:hypothetical protein
LVYKYGSAAFLERRYFSADFDAVADCDALTMDKIHKLNVVHRFEKRSLLIAYVIVENNWAILMASLESIASPGFQFSSSVMTRG